MTRRGGRVNINNSTLNTCIKEGVYMNRVRQPVLFSRKIKCAHCGKNFKGKMERKRRVYVCGNYDNHGKCQRNPLEQDMIVNLLKRRFGDDISNEFVKNIVHKIEFTNKDKFKIVLNNSNNPIEFGDNYIHF